MREPKYGMTSLTHEFIKSAENLNVFKKACMAKVQLESTISGNTRVRKLMTFFKQKIFKAYCLIFEKNSKELIWTIYVMH